MNTYTLTQEQRDFVLEILDDYERDMAEDVEDRVDEGEDEDEAIGAWTEVPAGLREALS